MTLTIIAVSFSVFAVWLAAGLLTSIWEWWKRHIA